MKRRGRIEEISILVRRLKSYIIRIQASALQLRDRKKSRHSREALPAAFVSRLGEESEADLQEYLDRAE